MKIDLLILSTFITLLFSCTNNANKTDETSTTENIKAETPLKWPTGKYIYVTDQGMFLEEWARVDSFTFKGSNFLIDKKTNDTTFSMSIRLIKQKDKTTMFYFIKGLSKGDGTEFTLTKEDGDLYVFENPFHDFNSIIQYRIMGDTAIEVTERGFVENQERVERSVFKKID